MVDDFDNIRHNIGKNVKYITSWLDRIDARDDVNQSTIIRNDIININRAISRLRRDCQVIDDCQKITTRSKWLNYMIDSVVEVIKIAINDQSTGMIFQNRIFDDHDQLHYWIVCDSRSLTNQQLIEHAIDQVHNNHPLVNIEFDHDCIKCSSVIDQSLMTSRLVATMIIDHDDTIHHMYVEVLG